MDKDIKPLHWRIHTANLLNEILTGSERMGIFSVPIHQLGVMLAEVGERASELGDARLNLLCARLTLFEFADPQSKEYDPDMLKKLEEWAAADQERDAELAQIRENKGYYKN